MTILFDPRYGEDNNKDLHFTLEMNHQSFVSDFHSITERTFEDQIIIPLFDVHLYTRRMS